MNRTATMHGLLVSAVLGVVLPGPNGAYIAAAQDLDQIKKVSPGDLRYIRYLSLYSVPAAEPRDEPAQRLTAGKAGLLPRSRQRLYNSATYWINSLSPNRSEFYRPPLVGEGTLMRIDLRKLDWDKQSRRDQIALAKRLGVTLKVEADIWEQLVRRDPYFRVDAKVKKVVKGKAVEVLVKGWLDPETELKTRLATYSTLPVVRADWFLRETGFTSTPVRAPVKGLYDQFLLQPATLQELEKLIGANRDLVGGRGIAYGGGVTRSGVSLRNRGVEVYPTQVGGSRRDIWRTYDVKTNLDAQSIKRSFVGLNGRSTLKFDGGEAIYDLPNGLHGFVIFDAQERLIGDVPQEIAFRKGDDAPDTTVYPWNCVLCHRQGIIDFKDEQSRLAVNRDPVGVLPLQFDSDGKPVFSSFDHRDELRTIARLGETYHLSSRLSPTIKADQDAYVQAVKACNGLDSVANSDAFIADFEAYEYGVLNLAQAALEFGVTEDEARVMCHASGNPDLLDLIAGGECPRDAFEKAFPDAMRIPKYGWEVAK